LLKIEVIFHLQKNEVVFQFWSCNIPVISLGQHLLENVGKQAGAELCQAQFKLGLAV
jgi:hypothetical protein